jgi:hypothetical protein
MTKQTVGFNWGAAATGCSVWTGVPLRNILLQAGLKDKKDGARYEFFFLHVLAGLKRTKRNAQGMSFFFSMY